MKPLLRLLEHGQSYWLDNLTRGKIADGELERRVSEEGLRGITSNPAIFQKAISQGQEYDSDIERLAREGLSTSEIYERVVVDDIRAACDVLRPVYDDSDRADGFVSLEVSPYLAHDTEGSLEEARHLFRLVDRPNVMIKIPGTPAGVPAIEEALYEGINVNITLLFSIQSYEAVAGAYLRALERRAEAGRRVDDVASVASFFLSRIDVLVDRLLGHRIVPGRVSGPNRPEALLGRLAVANAKLAYRSFREMLGSERWNALEARGARPQRLLWASTSTKDPLYEDVRYVEPLIGPHTVNTMPDETIHAFAHHGRVADTVEEGLEEARETMDSLAALGIDFDRVTAQLQDEGVQKFIAPFDTLMGTLADRRRAVLGGCLASLEIRSGSLEGLLRDTLKALDARQFGKRLAARDPYLWVEDSGDAEGVRNRLGWLDSPRAFRERVEEIREFAREVRDAGVRHVVLLGMGGSSLSAEVCRDVLGRAEGWPELLVLDNTDPAAVAEVERRIDLERTLFLVASKSGTTEETLSFYRYFRQRVGEVEGEDAAGARFVAITDPDTPLAREAREREFRRLFENPEDIGGRYSALSYFGLLPLALLGADLEAVLDRALDMVRCTDPMVPASHDPGVRLGALLGIAARQGRDKVSLLFSDSLRPFGAWAEQLLAESSGKEGRGLVPVDGERVDALAASFTADRSVAADRSDGAGGTPGTDRLYVALRLREDDDRWGEFLEHRAAGGDPVARIELGGPSELGAEFFQWEVATATACAILGVNAFDEPNVAESKRNTREILESLDGDGELPEDEAEAAAADERLSVYGDGIPPGTDPAEAVRRFVDRPRPGEYLAILSYLKRTPERHEALQGIRDHVLRRTGVATTLGYGPRYLHSTGQLHKGGPESGRFLLVTADPERDLPIPGRPHGFGTLQRAQALGDWRALRERGRAVLRVHLRGEPEEALQLLRSRLEEGAERKPVDVV